MKVIEMKRTSMACPSQWDGLTDDNRKVYVRYRWGNLSVRVGPAGDNDTFAAVRGEEILSMAAGGGFDGFLAYGELRALCAPSIELPEAES